LSRASLFFLSSIDTANRDHVTEDELVLADVSLYPAIAAAAFIAAVPGTSKV